MNADDQDHGAGAPVMQPAQDRPEGDILHDELDRLVRLVRGRTVVHCQKHPRRGKQAEQQKAKGAERRGPARAGRKLFKEERLEIRLPADAVANLFVRQSAHLHEQPVAFYPYGYCRAGREAGRRALALPVERAAMTGTAEPVCAGLSHFTCSPGGYSSH